MNDNGIMVTGWAAVDGHWYYMEQWGGNVHRLGSSKWTLVSTWITWGAMQTGWVLVE